MKYCRNFHTSVLAALVAAGISSCTEDKITDIDIPAEAQLPEWYYAGGELCTTLISTSNAFEQPAHSV